VEQLAPECIPNGGFVRCGIGSLANPRLRLAGRRDETQYRGSFEILTLCGTVTRQGAHLHVSISSESGQVVGGHVAYGNEVRTTVELLLTDSARWMLSRERDPDTGFLELVAKPSGNDEGAA
jgi:predicted DNA-binding protein with PD1-like motif